MRPLIYIALGWLLLAAVGALGQTFGLTVMLPATSAALVAHVVFGRELSLPSGLAVAVTLGYLEDMAQGTPIGLLSLAYGLSCCALVWSSRRLAVEGPIARALAAGVAAALIDLVTFALLFSARRRLGVETEALLAGLLQARWHALATVLAAPGVFVLAELALGAWDRAFGRRPRPARRSPLQTRNAGPSLEESDPSDWT